MKKHLDDDEAFALMACFLERYWLEGGRQSDDIAVLLSGIQMRPDGITADPAMGALWRQCLDERIL